MRARLCVIVVLIGSAACGPPRAFRGVFHRPDLLEAHAEPEPNASALALVPPAPCLELRVEPRPNALFLRGTNKCDRAWEVPPEWVLAPPTEHGSYAPLRVASNADFAFMVPSERGTPDRSDAQQYAVDHHVSRRERLRDTHSRPPEFRAYAIATRLGDDELVVRFEVTFPPG